MAHENSMTVGVCLSNVLKFLLNDRDKIMQKSRQPMRSKEEPVNLLSIKKKVKL